MPNPKTGTVTFDVGKAVSDAKAGKLEYRTDRGANVHVPIGKKSFDERALVENYAALVEEIVRAKPAAAKGRYIKGITLTTTMGPGLHVDPARTRGHRRGARRRPFRPSVVSRHTTRRRRQPAAPPQTTGSRPRRRTGRGGGSRCARPWPTRLAPSPPPAGSIAFRGGERCRKPRRNGSSTELTERLRSSESLIVADYRGLTNSQLAGLRGELLEARRAAHGRQEHAHPAGGRGRRRGGAAGAARRPDGDRVRRGRGRSRRRREGTVRHGHATTKILALRGGVLSGNAITARRDRDAGQAAAVRRPAGAARRRDRGTADTARRRC